MAIQPYRVFVSHIHEERELAIALKNTIEDAFLGSVQLFVSSDEGDLRSGDDWFERVSSVLRESQMVLLLLTEKSVGRPWINFEAGAAWFTGIHIVLPLCTGRLRVDDLPPPFHRKQAIQLEGAAGFIRLVQEIARNAGLRVPSCDLATVIRANEALQSLPFSAAEEEDDSASSEDDSGLIHWSNSATAFGLRISDAFPGVRGYEEIADPVESTDRLSILLRNPLFRYAKTGEREHTSKQYPFWWFRGGSDCYIQSFQRLGADRCLMDAYELRIKRVVAIRPTDQDERDFVYVETDADEPIGLYTYPPNYLAEEILKRREYGRGNYVTEEFGLWQGRPITRDEYSDGAAMIDGRPTRTAGAELRIRYLTPFNFVICGQRHVINAVDRDVEVRNLLDRILSHELSPRELGNIVTKFPALRSRDWPDNI